ncbi:MULTISPECIES: baeRF12 domain-containing protein [Acetobacter]|jgi:protein required for attachment to host cells|uniref:Uncharacterized protein n=1 Tax=Acetobacter peroxydans TaxID=104098 RepID=A0A4Y3TTH9_9PROT|nr:host attachment protein [Acetobacter peroxydans]MCH4094661.1 host attachment protein [Acetobacter peroxydans]MCH4143209.1 host attachment protein [Acetobacter peroxydans]MCI1411676.1 host attachment protein [Acetobacter peroxydans]MCI1566994.1 host attachment protein [Acetobacter peroxydans]MCI1725364.1 host attachment protein [Acetobacter peroxydans]
MTEARDGQVVYVVADGGKVRFLHDHQGSMHDVQVSDSHDHTGTPGQMPAGASPSDTRKDAFARSVAEHMNAQVAHDGANVAGFVLAAPAHILHEIREHLSAPAAARVIKVLSKDLINIPAHDIRDHFDIPATGWVLPG